MCVCLPAISSVKTVAAFPWPRTGFFRAASCFGQLRRSGRAAMGFAARWANTRHAFGKAIGSYQGTSFKLADMAMEIHERAFSRSMPQPRWTPAQSPSARPLRSSVRLGNGRPRHRQCDPGPGGHGRDQDMPLERFWRDARVERIWEGTSEIHRDIIAKDVLREFAA